MTGFPRAGRSFYLDDLDLPAGALVICKCAMFGGFTPGRTYAVLQGGKLRDDAGAIVRPSARFMEWG